MWNVHSPNRYLSMTEACFELRLGSRGVLKLLNTGQLVGFKLPRRGKSRTREWRILDPGVRFKRYLDESRRHLEHVPLLSGREVAEVLGVTPGAVRQLKRRKQLCGTVVNHETLYTASEIRRLLLQRERQGRQSYSPVLVRWLQGLIAQDEHATVRFFDEMLSQVVTVPYPEKSVYLTELWWHFDTINDVLRSARLGEKAASAIKAARLRQRIHSPEVLEVRSPTDPADFLKIASGKLQI